jgi:hypothetical protein
VTPEPSGTPVDEIELVVMLRGRTVQRAFQELLRQPAFHVEIPDEYSLMMGLDSASMLTSGTGEAAAHRYDVTFRETEKSAARRAPDDAGPGEQPSPAAKPADEAEVAPEREIDWDEASAAWAKALRDKSAAAASPAPPAEPLTPAELAGAEAVLVGLRLDALITTLEQASIVQRDTIDTAFVALVAERFVAEASPVIGEDAARRAARAVANS